MGAHRPDIAELVKADHRRLQDLLDRFMEGPGDGRQLYTALLRELPVHQEAERRSLYQAAAGRLEDGKDRLAGLRGDDEAITQAVDALSGKVEDSADTPIDMGVLRRRFQSHAHQVEGSLLSAMGEELDQDQLVELGSDFLEAVHASPEGPEPPGVDFSVSVAGQGEGAWDGPDPSELMPGWDARPMSKEGPAE
ncbi:MAG: hemerythrin domain-containing protein [Acidimicrobiales bacterium]|nr:hemerythrin domain-containing protein [Acidimicrobiales bacterium]